jgi:hypothetical protein
MGTRAKAGFLLARMHRAERMRVELHLAAKINLARAPETDEERLAVRQLKTALNRLGYYAPHPKQGMNDDIDEDLKDAIYAYQRKSTIFYDDVDLAPRSTTERILNQDLDYMERDHLFSGAYVWRTVGDGKVRGEHAVRNGQTFLWSDPPEGGHPAEDYNCRCWAEHKNPPYHPWIEWINERRTQRLAQSATVKKLAPTEGLNVGIADLKTSVPVDAIKPVNLAWSAAAILVVLRLGGAVPVFRILSAFEKEKVTKSVDRKTIDEHVLKKPEGIPNDWVEVPHKNGRKFILPGKKGDRLWITKGSPDATFKGQTYDYVRWQKDGKPLDINGNVVEKKSLESHIPVKDFKFRPELFE